MIIKTEDFNLDYTLDCGQVFRWQRRKEWWIGVIQGQFVQARQNDDELLVKTNVSRDRICDYFRLDDDMAHIYYMINKDAIMEGLIVRFRGLRLIRQDPWECLISYMASSCKSIPNIKDSISNLCRLYGRDMGGYYSFPTSGSLACTTESQLRKTKLGFRAANILELAKCVYTGDIDLELPFRLEYEDARKMLMGIHGVGPKIADCVLLFAYGKLEAFPADTHILSIMNEHYSQYLKGPRNRLYNATGDFARSYFGNFAGYAQQYLYYSRISRNNALPMC